VNPRILVVGCGFPQLGLLRFCRSQGLTVIGADQNERAVGRSLCDEFVRVSTTSVEGLEQAAREHAVAGIVTAGSEHALLATALASERLGLPFYGDPETVRACQAKHEMRERYRRGGAPSPRYECVSSREEGKRAAARLGLPVVVKPTRGWGQRGVRVIKKEAELEAALDAAFASPTQAAEPSCLVEEFIEGREFSVDAYTRAGSTQVLAVTERIITAYPDPPGITYAEVYPPELSPEARALVEDAAIRGIAALGIERGPTYTQLRLGARGPALIETAFRLGGGLDPEVTFLASGVSLYRRIVGVALRRPEWEASAPEAPLHAGATGRFLIGKPGRVAAVNGLSFARSLPGVIDAAIYVEPGELVHPLTDGSKRVGHVLAVGSGRAHAEANAARAMRAIGIDTRPPELEWAAQP
jgi:S-sulfo-L-cysteine synthase (3-phospho-L-serine-dependent)